MSQDKSMGFSISDSDSGGGFSIKKAKITSTKLDVFKTVSGIIDFLKEKDVKSVQLGVIGIPDDDLFCNGHTIFSEKIDDIHYILISFDLTNNNNQYPEDIDLNNICDSCDIYNLIDKAHNADGKKTEVFLLRKIADDDKPLSLIGEGIFDLRQSMCEQRVVLK